MIGMEKAIQTIEEFIAENPNHHDNKRLQEHLDYYYNKSEAKTIFCKIKDFLT